MIESLVSVVGQRGVDAAAFLLAFALTALTDSLFHNKLPHDHGREFAVNGGLSKGKARGSGLIFLLLIVILVWASINVVNCTDGVDGLSASLAVVTIGTYLIAYHEELADYSTAGVVFMGALLAYLWSNAKPSTLLMGDAGSRAMGFFIAILSLKCGHPFAFLLAAIVFIVDGSLGILKISLKRFLHISILKNTRTPLHDHVRKNKGWSDEQVVARWLILQCVASALLLLLVRG